jgi:glycosyltransferase involved in cell wall biosynthesis
MKAVHIIGSKTLGGAERFFLRLVHALNDRMDITAILRKGSEVTGVMGKASRFSELPMRTVWDPFSRMEISREINKIGPDIVQTYMGRATRLTRIPSGKGIVHVARLGGYYRLDCYRHAHAWIGNTKGVCDFLIRNGFSTERVFCIGNFIDPPVLKKKEEIMAFRRSLNIPDDALMLMAAGRFIEIKGYDHLIKAFSMLPDTIQGKRPWLLLVGDGPLYSGLKGLAESLSAAERITWTGWRNDPDPFYQIADLVVFPSLEMETLGNVILEAWAHGKPILVTKFRGAVEITRHGLDAWQVPCEDPASLSRGILKVLNDDSLMTDISREGHRRSVNEFGREVIVSQYLELYKYLRETTE